MKTFISPDRKFTLIIPTPLLEEIRSFCEAADRHETGGILVGKYYDDQHKARLNYVSNAPPDSQRGATWFVRGLKGLQVWVDRLWKSGKGYYIGEWHFHPYSSPSPSTQDISVMKRIAGNKGLNCPEPILIILGGDPNTKWNLSVTIVTSSQNISLQEVTARP